METADATKLIKAIYRCDNKSYKVILSPGQYRSLHETKYIIYPSNFYSEDVYYFVFNIKWDSLPWLSPNIMNNIFK